MSSIYSDKDHYNPAALLITGRSMEYYSEDLPPGTGVRQQAGRAFRCLRTGDLDVALELVDEVGITVELSDEFTVRRRLGHSNSLRPGRFGNVTVDRPGELLNLSIRGECRVVQLALPASQLIAFAEEDHDRDVASLPLLPAHGLRDMRMLQLVCHGVTQPEGEEEVLREVVAHLLANYSPSRVSSRSTGKGGLPPRRLRRVQEFVDANLASATLSGIAAEVALSPFHFAREFKRTTGEAPWSYVVSRRLARAITLLGSADFTVEQVAAAAGFPHASHMNRHLRHRMGASATGLRARLLA